MKGQSIIAATFGFDTIDMGEYRYKSTRTLRAIYAIGDHYYAVGQSKPQDDVGGEWRKSPDQFWAATGNTILWVCDAITS